MLPDIPLTPAEQRVSALLLEASAAEPLQNAW